MLKIRLKRIGRKKRPSYRIIAIDSRKRRDGQPIEELGFYNSLTKNSKFNIIKIKQHIENGAQLTDKVKYLLNQTLSNNTI